MDAAQGFSSGGYVEIVKGNVIFTAAQVVRRFMLKRATGAEWGGGAPRATV